MTASEKRTLKRITRGLAHLPTLRDIMNEVYRRFDRRCRTNTDLEKLARLCSHVRRFKHVGRTLNKLFSPNLDKALTFLDDSLLPAISNAAERGFRRHRKMHKSVYRVPTREQISRRIAVDMQAYVKTKTELVIHNIGITRSGHSLAKRPQEVKNADYASQAHLEVTNMS